MLDQLLSLIAPHYCINCNHEGSLLCLDCRAEAISSKRSSCFLCNRLTEGWRTCASCRRKTKIGGVVVASHYDGAAKLLIRRLKYEHAVAAAPILADLLAEKINPKNFDMVTAIPASSRRFRQRGYNQAQLIAKRLGRQLKLPYAELLGRTGQVRQVGTNRRQRLAQMAGQMYSRRNWLAKNNRILVVDDVVTTGATLSEAGRVLKSAGAKTVWGAAAAKH